MMSAVASLERDDPTMPAKKTAAKKPAARPVKKTAPKPRAVKAVPRMEPEHMDDLLLAIHDKANEIDDTRALLENLISESDQLIREAVDEGERYRDIANSAGRTVPWVQMSLRRVHGVPTHPAAPVPTTRIRKTRRAS